MPVCRSNSIKDDLFYKGGFCALHANDGVPPARPNTWCAEEEGEDTCSLPSRRGSPLFRFSALLVVIIFTILVLGRFLEIFTFPTLNFLVTSQKLNRDPLVRELKQAVVCVTATPRGKDDLHYRQQRGTGFNITPEGLIVTNRHLVEDAGSLNVSFYEQGNCQVAGWSSNPTADLALITLTGGEFPFVDLASEPLPAVGEEVIIIGNPLNYFGVAMRGEITGYWQLDEFSGPVMEIDASIHKGNSGSPVFNAEGKVVAVIFATVGGQGKGDIRGLALPVALLKDFLSAGDWIYRQERKERMGK